MSLPSPSHLVIGATAPEASVEFLELFGFVPTRRGELPAEAARLLYGVPGPAPEVVLEVPGAESGWLRVVGTPNPARTVAPLDNRPLALDLFSTDIERSQALAREAGFHVSPVAVHQFGPLTIKEVEVKGPDALVVTLLETPARRPSVLDQEPSRLHSEVHALVWSVQEIDRWLPFWQRQAGHQVLTDATFDSPGMGAVLGVPDKTLRLRLAVFADSEARPVRLEMLEFLGEEVDSHPDFPLAGGLYAPAFTVEALGAAASTLDGAQLGEVVEVENDVHGRARAVSGRAPGGLRFELWEEG
jgi:hypothetical protein